MANYFNNYRDVGSWIKSRPTPDVAAQELFEVADINGIDLSKMHASIDEYCKNIHQDNDAESNSRRLFQILAQCGVVNMNDTPNPKMTKEAQTSRQRNKWNRVVDGFNEGTPWRVCRDKFYNFTHYYTDAIAFDEDPDHIYSGEALWRKYIMDKFSSDYQDENGNLVGGYLNERFHVFKDAGTPANPDVPRDGGNKMALGVGERSRKPRPHQYSMERRLEEARGNKTHDITASKFNSLVKLSNKQDKESTRVYEMLKDVMAMKENGEKYENIIKKVANKHNASVLGVAQIIKFANAQAKKHEGMGYVFAQVNQDINDDLFVPGKKLYNIEPVAVIPLGNQVESLNDIPGNLDVMKKSRLNANSAFIVKEVNPLSKHQILCQLEDGSLFIFESAILNAIRNSPEDFVQDADIKYDADELGLTEDVMNPEVDDSLIPDKLASSRFKIVIKK